MRTAMHRYPPHDMPTRKAWRQKYGKHSPGRAALLAEFEMVFDVADRIVVSDCDDASVVYESTAADDIRALQDCLVLEPAWRAVDCMCRGLPKVELFVVGLLVVEIRNLHTQAVRCSLWDHPVAVRDVDKWVSWFDARHIEGPADDPGRFSRPTRVRRTASPTRTNSFGAIPESLASRIGFINLGGGNIRRLRIAHERAVPDAHRRVRELLEWFGSGVGPWSGFPGWELVPEHLLREYPFKTIVDAIGSGPLGVRQTEGAARLFASWSYQPRFTRQVADLPSALKSQLWEHVAGSDDPDKRQKAAHAFGVEG